MEIQSNAETELFLIHSGQHYDFEMAQSFYDEFEFPQPDCSLQIPKEGDNLEKVIKILEGIREIFTKHSFDCVIVQGDTNTAMIAGVAAIIFGIPVCHIEAGCRSFDRSMPEEMNRIMLDHISDLLFAPTNTARLNLQTESIDPNRIVLSGNTLNDILPVFLDRTTGDLDDKDPRIIQGFCLATIHREGNTDSRTILERIFQSLTHLGLPVVIPLHPRTHKRLSEFGLSFLLEEENMIAVHPMSYTKFLSYLSRAELVITDSGGVQTEAAAIGTPCITLRNTTEWPETVWSGINTLCDPEYGDIVGTARLQLKRKRKKPLLKSSMAAKTIIARLIAFLENPPSKQVDMTMSGYPVLQAALVSDGYPESLGLIVPLVQATAPKKRLHEKSRILLEKVGIPLKESGSYELPKMDRED